MIDLETCLKVYLLPSPASQRQLLIFPQKELERKIKSNKGGVNVTYLRGYISHIHEVQKFLNFHRFMGMPSKLGAKNILLFCPLNSTIRQEFMQKDMSQLTISPILDDYWNPVVHILRGHFERVLCCAYSNDGQYVASGSYDGSISIWDAKIGKAQQRFQLFPDYVNRLTVSSRGLIAASNKYCIKIWNFHDGNLQKSIDGQGFCG